MEEEGEMLTVEKKREMLRMAFPELTGCCRHGRDWGYGRGSHPKAGSAMTGPDA